MSDEAANETARRRSNLESSRKREKRRKADARPRVWTADDSRREKSQSSPSALVARAESRPRAAVHQ